MDLIFIDTRIVYAKPDVEIVSTCGKMCFYLLGQSVMKRTVTSFFIVRSMFFIVFPCEMRLRIRISNITEK